MRSVMRSWALAVMALAVWLLAAMQWQPDDVAPANAPAAAFSALRAEAVLARILGPERPHPVGSAENAAVRARILAEFAKQGVRASTYRAFSCQDYGKFRLIACATVTDVIAQALPGTGKAVVLMAHYDSVPAGPGASDDESGVAAVLETVRALKASGKRSLHPVLALITDGEESGLLGANAFLENAALKSRVGAVVNVEARGTSGTSTLFQTSAGDGRLIDLYAHSVRRPATSSLYAEIYKVMPNDTDLTLFIRDGFPAYNFAFIDNVRYYHSPFDTRAHLNPATLQMQGDNLLGVASALSATPFAALQGGNDIYVSLFGLALPRLPAAWALPLAIAVLLVLALAALRAGLADAGARTLLAAFAAPLLLWVGAGLAGWLLSLIAQTISGHPDPSYAYPLAMRLALAFAIWAMTLAASRLSGAKALAFAAWAWMAVLGILTAAFVPGVSPYFLFPSVVAALLLAVTARKGWTDRSGQLALLAGAFVALLLWMPVAFAGEIVMGLRLHPLFTIPLALGFSPLLPLLAAAPMKRACWRFSTGFSVAAAFFCAVVAGFLPAYSARSPQRVDLVYLENGKAPARAVADTSWKGIGTEPLPATLKQTGGFKYDRDAWEGLRSGSAYAAPTGTRLYPLPTARIVAAHKTGRSETVDLAFDGSAAGARLVLRIPERAAPQALDIRGQHFDLAGARGDTFLVCDTVDCLHLRLKLTLARPATLAFAEERFGLPPSEQFLIRARPPTAMASQSGDVTVLADTLAIPGP